MNKFYTKIYFIVWLLLLSSCFASKIFFIPILDQIAIVPLLIGIFIITSIIFIISGMKFLNYLKINYNDKWTELSNKINVPWGSVASDFPNDKKLLEIETMHRRAILVLLFSFFSIPVIVAIMIAFNINK